MSHLLSWNGPPNNRRKITVSLQIIKLQAATEWKVLNLRDLVNRLVKVLSAQQRDLEQAIMDMENFQLAHSYKTHEVNFNVW